MKKSVVLTLAFTALLIGIDTDEASARGRYGGGMSYSRTTTAAYRAPTNYAARTRPVEPYHANYGATGAYRTTGVTAAAYRPYGTYGTAGAVAVTTRRTVGYRTPYLPVGYTALAVGAATYYSYGDDYYSYDDSSKQYTVVQPPIGANVYQLPVGATLVAGHNSLYVANGVYYRPSYADGAIVYTVSNP